MKTMKNIIIIGATSGIGRAVAEIYLAQGHRVGVTGRRTALLEEFASAAPAGRVFTRTFDVSSGDAAAQLAALVDEMGGVDICLYSSGFGHTNTILEPSLELGQVDVNAKGFVSCAVWLFNYWAGNGLSGQLAVISSVASILPLGVCERSERTTSRNLLCCVNTASRSVSGVFGHKRVRCLLHKGTQTVGSN